MKNFLGISSLILMLFSMYSILNGKREDAIVPLLYATIYVILMVGLVLRDEILKIRK